VPESSLLANRIGPQQIHCIVDEEGQQTVTPRSPGRATYMLRSPLQKELRGGVMSCPVDVACSLLSPTPSCLQSGGRTTPASASMAAARLVVSATAR